MSGSASLGLEQAILGHTLGFAPMTAPARVFVALCMAATPPAENVRGIEASGLGYYRTPATFALATSPANMAANVAVIEFPMALAAWGSVGYFELWDAQIGGNRLYWGQLIDHTSGVPATLTVASGDIVRFSPGTLAVQAASGVGGVSSSPWLPLTGGTVTGTTTYTAATAITPLLVNRNPVVSGSSLAQSFYTNTNASGATSATGQPLWNMFLTTDSVNATGANSIANVGNYYTLQGSSGARIAQQISLSINSNTADPPGSSHYFQALGCSILANGTVGGSSGAHTGQAFGANITATLGAAAKYLISVVGFEADVACQAGSSVDYKYGITAVLQNADAVASTFPSAALSVGLAVDSPASPGWRYGLAFGGPLGWWPINPTTGVLIYADPSGQSGGPAHTAASGIDFSAVTFSSAFLKSNGFLVDGSGHCSPLLLNAANDAAAATAGVPIGAMYRNANAVQVRLV